MQNIDLRTTADNNTRRKHKNDAMKMENMLVQNPDQDKICTVGATLRHFPDPSHVAIPWKCQQPKQPQMQAGAHTRCPLCLSDFSQTSIVSPEFSNKLKYKISLKSVQRESSCSTRRDGLARSFPRLDQAPKKVTGLTQNKNKHFAFNESERNCNGRRTKQ